MQITQVRKLKTHPLFSTSAVGEVLISLPALPWEKPRAAEPSPPPLEKRKVTDEELLALISASPRTTREICEALDLRGNAFETINKRLKALQLRGELRLHRETKFTPSVWHLNGPETPEV